MLIRYIGCALLAYPSFFLILYAGVNFFDRRYLYELHYDVQCRMLLAAVLGLIFNVVALL